MIEDQGDFVRDLRDRLRSKGLPKMDLTCNFHEDGDLTVFISNCSLTGFTTESYYPEGQDHGVEEIAEDLFQTFLSYVDFPDVTNTD